MKIKKLHKWNVTPHEAIEIQKKLRKKIDTAKTIKNINLIAGADASVSLKLGLIKASVCLLSFPDLRLVEKKSSTFELAFPYVPGLLSFREGPALLDCFRKIKNIPDVIIFDGQGLAHPRRMGIATHMGILLGMPTIGCGKSPLYGRFEQPGNSKGDHSFIYDKEGDVIGVCLRTRSGVKPVYVSVGSNINLSGAIKTLLGSLGKYRLPEPIRFAHNAAKIKA